MPHYDAGKVLHDPHQPPQSVLPPARPIVLDVDRIAAPIARALARKPPDEREMLERIYVQRLLDHGSLAPDGISYRAHAAQ